MAVEFLQQQFPNLQDKLLNLQTQINSGRLTANKDLYIAAMIPSLAGTEKSMSVHEFLRLENSDGIGNW